MSKKGFPGKSLSNTQTCSSKGSYPPVGGLDRQGSAVPRARVAHPSGAKLPGKGLSNTQTSSPTRTRP